MCIKLDTIITYGQLHIMVTHNLYLHSHKNILHHTFPLFIVLNIFTSVLFFLNFCSFSHLFS